jgi:VIT1/CCC1 family predicted Fe2+/Mn2+ transporter
MRLAWPELRDEAEKHWAALEEVTASAGRLYAALGAVLGAYESTSGLDEALVARARALLTEEGPHGR